MSIQITRRRNDGGHAGPDVVPFNNCFVSHQDAIYVCYGIIYSWFKNSDNQAGLACPKAIFGLLGCLRRVDLGEQEACYQ